MNLMYSFSCCALLTQAFFPLVMSQNWGNWGDRHPTTPLTNAIAPTTFQTSVISAATAQQTNVATAQVTTGPATTDLQTNTVPTTGPATSNLQTDAVPTTGPATTNLQTGAIPTTGSNPSPTGGAGTSCVQFEFISSDPSYAYSLQSTSGSYTGTFGGQSPNLCASGGGALFFGSDASLGWGAGAGNTKLEWFISGDGSQQSTVDISVCDGFSLAMQCIFPEGILGGTQSLLTLGTCPYPNGPNCVNGVGGQDSHNNVAQPFFQKGGNYWYQDNTYKGVSWTGSVAQGTVKCTIGG